VIDCAGKHITPGLIDCHSHTGISKGVNESGQAVTSEVRIGDVTNPDAISWYRQLAGGITTVNNLHGSANTIGGQNQVNKNRWGAIAPNDLHFQGAISGIKFALGENVKQSNWGENNTWRYPQTRMGVEALLRDRFTAAKAYLKQYKDAGLDVSKAPENPPQGLRRDLELEALAQILDGSRLIHCHSYRQDEIYMLAKLSAEFGFKLGSYQHILEGYKVAREVRDSARGASAFSDWWAFKLEVQDAIPHAGVIMHEQGVVVSYNSDSDELARRMNVEASKAVKYSRVPASDPSAPVTLSDEDALKFVTLHPAIQLGIEDRVGSIAAGKDADLVVWSGPPLSTLSIAERTIIDGREYWSIAKDRALQERNRAERQRLIQKLLAEAKKDSDRNDAKPTVPGPSGPSAPSGPTGSPPTFAQGEDDAGGSLMARMLDQSVRARRELFLRRLMTGHDAESARAGECGCGF
jgi:imidazolonepropionase-like amidohydrolase